jgi:hypothetical protein
MALVAGWILPTALNLIAIGVLIVPSVDHGPAAAIDALSVETKAALLAAAAVVGGLVLNMLQTPLYRILEGYLGWPQFAFERRKDAHRSHKHRIIERISLIKSYRELTLEPGAKLPAKFEAMPRRDMRRSAPQRALLREELRRYPVDDDQVLPTRLGNGIRRLEEYGWNRYRLDSQRLWSRLIAVVPEPVRKQVDSAQIGVDFFVCLLYGHVVVAVIAAAAVVAEQGYWPTLAAAVVLPLALVPLWYRLAVSTTDQWAAAVQALVDLGRHPLATAYGLAMPDTLEEERTMWERVSRFASREYDEARGQLLNEFREQSTTQPTTKQSATKPDAA